VSHENGWSEWDCSHRIQDRVKALRALLHVGELPQEVSAQLRLPFEPRVHPL
jgi:hypothetical protein